jgi:hypothetical protein
MPALQIDSLSQRWRQKRDRASFSLAAFAVSMFSLRPPLFSVSMDGASRTYFLKD